MGQFQKRFEPGLFALTEKAISVQPSAPQIVAQIAIAKISSNLCSFVRSTLGSVTSVKKSNNLMLIRNLLYSNRIKIYTGVIGPPLATS